MESLWLKRARRGGRWTLVVYALSLPFGGSVMVKIWKRGIEGLVEPSSLERARHLAMSNHALQKSLAACFYWGGVLVPAIGGLLFLIPLWWLTSTPEKGEADHRWRWGLLRWSYVACWVYEEYDRVVRFVPTDFLATDQKALASAVKHVDFPTLAVISAMILYVVFTELGERRAKQLAVGLIGLAVVEWLFNPLRAASPRLGNHAAAALFSIGLFDQVISAILYFHLGWPRRRAPEDSRPAATADSHDLGLVRS